MGRYIAAALPLFFSGGEGFSSACPDLRFLVIGLESRALRK
jgi:hypothetical protein